jgi:hypothetical protein
MIRRPRVYRIAVHKALRLRGNPEQMYAQVCSRQKQSSCTLRDLLWTREARGPPVLEQLTEKQQNYYKDNQ